MAYIAVWCLFHIVSFIQLPDCRYGYRKMNEELLVVQLRKRNCGTVELQQLVGEEAEKNLLSELTSINAGNDNKLILEVAGNKIILHQKVDLSRSRENLFLEETPVV